MIRRGEGVLDRMAREQTLWGSWARVAAGSGIAGADGTTVEAFGRQLGSRLDQLGAALRDRTYAPQPLRACSITRGGRRRRLGLPTVRDRVAQRAFLDVCRRRLDAASAEVSFAYRRGRSWLDALAEAERCRDAGLRTVLRADIADFFDEIRHDLLGSVLSTVLDDPDGVELAMSWVAAPMLTEYGLVERHRGVPEGAPLSPALANLYLRDFDHAVHGRHGHLVRYADDVAVFCADLDEAVGAAADIDAALAAHGLRINPAKTYISNFDTGFSFLGWVFYQDGGWEESPTEGWTHPMSVGRGITGGIARGVADGVAGAGAGTAASVGFGRRDTAGAVGEAGTIGRGPFSRPSPVGRRTTPRAQRPIHARSDVGFASGPQPSGPPPSFSTAWPPRPGTTFRPTERG